MVENRGQGDTGDLKAGERCRSKTKTVLTNYCQFNGFTMNSSEKYCSGRVMLTKEKSILCSTLTGDTNRSSVMVC